LNKIYLVCHYCIFADIIPKLRVEKRIFLFFKPLKHEFMIIRKGTPEDMTAVLELIQELANFEKEPDAVLINVDDLIRDGFGPTPLFHVFVAEVESEIVGIALYYYRYSTWKGKTIHLEDLVVKEKMRGTGAGYALYSEIIKQGKKDQVRRVEWNVLDWNTPAIDFYEKSGAKVLRDWYVVQMDEEGVNQFVENKLKK
jgi:GNAT superfamily N-acetyltransferase